LFLFWLSSKQKNQIFIKWLYIFIFTADVGVGHGLALFSILSALFIALVLYIFEKRIKNLKIPISLFSFVNDRLFISQEKYFDILNANLFCSYNIMSSLLEQFVLIVEHGKTKVSIFLGCLTFLVPYLWTSVKSVVPFSILKTLGNILGLSLIENSYFVNISSFILTRPYLL